MKPISVGQLSIGALSRKISPLCERRFLSTVEPEGKDM
jgi:hypothetical protein